MSSAEKKPFADEVERTLREIGRADLVVGIPSYNNARTIGHVVRAVMAGLAKYFPDHVAVIVNSDGGSKDGTPEVVRQTALGDYRTVLAAHPLRPIHRLTTPYRGVPGKGSALRLVFEIAVRLQARACAVVDADVRSITPEWMDLLLSPVVREGFDFVAPLYRRHKYDGTITNSIVYPLTRALYGKRVRQPIGGDFGFSGRLAAHYLAQDVWHTDVARFGVDIWMTTTAITGGFRVCQAFLGAKIHDAKDPSVDLSGMLMQVVGSVFDLMEANFPIWARVRGSEPVPTFGLEYEVGLEPIRVNVERMLGIFRLGAEELKDLWQRILSAATFRQVQQLAESQDVAFRFPSDVWVAVIYDFALAFHRRVIHRDHLLQALVPLYLGRTASFVLETSESTADEVEAVIEALCQHFEERKPELVAQWEGPRAAG
ncbi:MAG: glycosyltransferase [Blastocatellia bacterium]|nr:glycosyltransferase [Blastocatellia bacterium]MCS7158128.1 glycosyltransferase [Blastocatellia bacterium]MCX7753009.1 glycosyltransferase [Blastocatellia bacterium]MDW8168532.1 glycosyltransferase [Acidobacteriota bacterium]MDW8256946.1 glycosyltransferase [Acidobacteriota bacterium]